MTIDGNQDYEGKAQQLREACGRKDLETARALLAAGAPVNAKDERGKAALHFAAKAGNVPVMKLLLDNHADITAVTKKKKSALYVAAFRGGVNAVRFLLKRQHRVDVLDKVGRTVLFGAAQHNDVDSMHELIDNEVDVLAVTTIDKRTALHDGAYCGGVEAVKLLVASGIPVDATDIYHATAFHRAAMRGHVAVMKELADRGANVHAVMKDGKTALHLAARSRNVEAVSFLLERGLSVNAVDEALWTAFHCAAGAGDACILRKLLQDGSDAHAVTKDGKTAMHCAAASGNLEAVKFLLEQNLSVNALDEGRVSVIHSAALGGDVGIITLLLDHGADLYAITSANETALHKAAYGSKSAAISMLIERGLAIDAADEDGSTILHKAAYRGDVGAVRLLVDHGANVDARTKIGTSALHICAEYGATEAAEILLERGASVNAIDLDGKTPLHEASKSGKVKMMKLLVDRGADVHTETKTRRTIAHMAVESAKPGALQYAIDLGVDVNGRVKIGDVLLSPLMIALTGDDCEKANEMVFSLCSAGACFEGGDRKRILAQSETTDASLSGGRETNTPAEATKWCSVMCVCVDHWTSQYQAGASKCTKVPMEVIRRGEDSVKTYLMDAAQSTDEDRLHRCKVCVVGPSEWGKTSLVHSMKAGKTFLTQLNDRTIGIDLVTCELPSALASSRVPLEITFWDFAGQDIYHAAHTLFFSKRTLYVLVVDLEAYWKELKNAESKSDKVSEAQMNRFTSDKIFRWIRSIFSHRTDAQFVVVGSKMNRLDSPRAVTKIWNDLRDRVDHWKAAYAEGFNIDLLPVRAGDKETTDLQAKLSQLVKSKWFEVDIMKVDSIHQFRSTIQSTIESSKLGFEMQKTYTSVLRSVVKRRNEARQKVNTRERIEKSIVPFNNLRNKLMEEIDGLERKACKQIVRTLNDLGDVLWYEHKDAGVFKESVILDPKLVIEIVREVVRHDFSSYADGKPPADGRITHLQLRTFPLWKDMDVELLHAFKSLLQHFQLAYPADADTMLPESDIIVPAYWSADHSSMSEPNTTPTLTIPRTPDFAAHRWCWEYAVPSELSETIFVQFAVRSHSSYLARTIRGFCVETACADFSTRVTLRKHDSPRDVLRIEVSGVSAELSWHNMRFYLMKMEKVLEGYTGDVVWRSIVYRPIGSTSESHHPVGQLVKEIGDAIEHGIGNDAVRERMPWMPPDMDWFMRKVWNDIASFQQLRMDQLVLDKLEVLRKLAIAGNAPRQFPALWSLEYIPEEKKALLRMSSDLSGRCYHVPLEINTGSPLLARNASYLKEGVSLFATVAGNAIPIPFLKIAVGYAKSVFDYNADHAKRVHSLIDKLDMTSGHFDTRSANKLSPGASMVLLRDLLKAYNDSLDALEISDISNLQCAVTAGGEYVWAHESEIAVMEGKLTLCSTPPIVWNDSDSPEMADPGRNKNESKANAKFNLCVDSVVGLSDWDWYKTYCNWQLYFGKQSRTPLAMGVTPTNSDSSYAPSWRTLHTTIESVASVEELRECRLVVQVKRLTWYFGWTKVIGTGHVSLRDFVDEDTAQNFSCKSVVVPLGETTEQAVIVRLERVQ